MRLHHHRKKKGFTLVEVVISLLVLTIGIVGVIALLPVCLRAGKQATDMTQAAFFAQDKLEELKRDGYDALPSVPEEGSCSNSVFSYKVEVGGVIDPPGNLKEVKVTISWGEGNKNYEKDFTTLITKY